MPVWCKEGKCETVLGPEMHLQQCHLQQLCEKTNISMSSGVCHEPTTCLLLAPCRHNYYGTQGLLQLSSEMPELRSFVHVSTFFVNNHMPRNSVVPEAIHAVPLELAGQPVQHQEFVEAVMAMDSQAANRTVLELMGRNNFNSTYAFGKHLTELLVIDTPLRPGVQRAIVRPSLIFGLLGDPYPG